MNSADRIVPFVVASFLLHLGASFWYVYAFRGRPLPVPEKEAVYKVNLVELPEPKPAEPEPAVRPEEKPEPKAEQPKKIPEKVRPREEKKKEEKPKPKVVEEKPAPEEEKKAPEPPAPALARQEPVESPRLVSSNPVTVEAENFAFSYYLALIQNRVGGLWNPPKGLVVTHPRVYVRFEILRSGRISSPQVTRSSGQAFFDLSAMRAVQEADPFPPLPDGFEGERLAVNFIFHYDG